MIHRRQALQSILGYSAGYAVLTSQTAFGVTSELLSVDLSPTRMLINQLHEAIRLCQDHHRMGAAIKHIDVQRTQNFCQIAISKVQRATDDSAAFWQACNDAVGRLESALSAHRGSDLSGQDGISVKLHQLRSLRKQLVSRTVQAFGASSSLV